MMASLKFIMDVNVDDQPDRQPALNINKKDQGPSKPATTGHLQEAHTTTNPPPRPRHARSPGLATEQDINLPVPPPQTKRRGGASSRASKSSASTTRATPAATGAGTSTNTGETESTSPSLSPAAKRPSARRTSTTSTDSMDRSQGYGSAASSSSMGGGGGPMRPMPQQPPTSDMHVRLTPITGRVSRAKKGVPVHVCDVCKPHKTFTRAEHLRRHQLSHGTPQFPCPGCDKVFHRQDLLTRHQQKSDHGGEAASKSGSAHDSPHPSPATVSSSRPTRSSGSSSVQPGPQVQQPGLAAASSPSVREMSTPPVSASYAGGYELANNIPPGVSVISPAVQYHHQPRTAQPMGLHLVTEGLLLPGLQPSDFPDARDTSPWPSSASDSTYSTPVSEPRNPRLLRGPPALLPQFPSGARVVEAPNIDAMPVPPMYISHYTSNPQQQQHSYGPNMYSMGGMSSIGYGATDGTNNHHSGLGNLHHHQNGNPNSSMRDSTPPSHTAPHANGGLLTAHMPSLQAHEDPLRPIALQKQRNFADAPAGMTFSALEVRYGGSGNASPSGDSGSHGRIMDELNLELGGCAMPMQVSGPMAIPLLSPINDAIPRYLETYWNRVHPTMPVVHRKSYEAHPEGVLTCAMAAVATQFLDDKEDRTRGNHLHDYAWQEVKRIAKWDLQTKQAILLCEYFARFRGRKAVTSPSKMFRSLYERGLYDDDMDHAMINSDEHNNVSLEVQWSRWIRAESSRRLLTACFLCDGHTSIYQQMPRAQDYQLDTSPLLQCIPLFGGSQRLWEASSAEEWANILTSNEKAAEIEYVPELESLTADTIMSYAPVDQMVILGRCALRLPRRPNSRTTSVSENNTPAPDFGHHSQHLGAQAAQFNTRQPAQFQSGFPVLAQEEQSIEAENRITALFGDCPVANTYLALHHTPLRDLLAVSGDSWLYSQKVLPANLFQDHQKRLRQWVMNKLAGYNPVKATMYAARAITLFLARQPGPQGCDTESAPWSTDLSDYWALYVCALICWAFGFHAQQQGQPRQRSSSGDSSPASKGGNGMSMNNTDEDVLNWLRMVADKNTPLAEIPRLRRHEATGVVGLVRRKLASCIGGRNRLYVDAVGVLERLEHEREGRNRKLF